jgi:hypothetical protein
MSRAAQIVFTGKRCGQIPTVGQQRKEMVDDMQVPVERLEVLEVFTHQGRLSCIVIISALVREIKACRTVTQTACGPALWL